LVNKISLSPQKEGYKGFQPLAILLFGGFQPLAILLFGGFQPLVAKANSSTPSNSPPKND